jgi:hypothetical protein
MTRVTLTLKEDKRIEIRCQEPTLREDRNFKKDDLQRFDR